MYARIIFEDGSYFIGAKTGQGEPIAGAQYDADGNVMKEF